MAPMSSRSVSGICARARLAPSIPIGVNLGKSKVTPLEEAATDYLYSFRRLAPVADYIVLNVSSPNTPGLRTLQEHDALVGLLRIITMRTAELASPKPLLLKIAPDLSEEALAEIAGACEKFGLAGMIATNTTLDHSALTSADEAGGLSGAPFGPARPPSSDFCGPEQPCRSLAAAESATGIGTREVGSRGGASPNL